MNHTAGKYGWLEAPQAYVSLKHEVDKLIAFERAGLLFIFNLHPTNSYTDYRVGVEEAGEYKIVLNSDEKIFGGFDNVKNDSVYFTTPMTWNNRKNFLQVSTGIRDLHIDHVLMLFLIGLYPIQDMSRPR